MNNIVILDTDTTLKEHLKDCPQKVNVSQFSTTTRLFSHIKSFPCDLLFIEPSLNGINAKELIKQLQDKYQLTIVLTTALTEINHSVQLLKMGIENYLLKPLIKSKTHELIEKLELTKERKKISTFDEETMIASSPKMVKVLNLLLKVAKSQSHVLIQGESGTGKEVAARILHQHSLRNNQSFIKVNCAAIPDTLVESEFFGHEKGSFTGALATRIGRFELANKGSILLDEITEVPLSMQAKLLRAIQEMEFERVGGQKTLTTDVRIISTSNQNLKLALDEKRFRSDLYYRLNVIPIHIPPLRERKEDIIPLAIHFLKQLSIHHQESVKTLTPSAQKKLVDHHWPGNIRELSNVIERSCILCEKNSIAASSIFLDNL